MHEQPVKTPPPLVPADPGSHPDRRKVVISDRLKSYDWIKRRQFCRAHLDRDFRAMVDRGGESAEVGRPLLAYSREVFDWWHRVRDGAMARATLRTNVSILRILFRSALSEGVGGGCAKTAGTCRELLAGETHLRTFVRVDGVEPTNNDAERALRHGVIYRKTSGGTDSKPGEPVHRADALGGGGVPPARDQRAGLSDRSLPGSPRRFPDPFAHPHFSHRPSSVVED